MNTLPIVDILLLRHGRTDYTEKGLDLTQEGEEHSRLVAKNHVLPWLDTLQVSVENLSIITSGAARAKGTATVISKTINQDRGFVVYDMLRPMGWRDPSRALAILSEMKKRGGYIDYETEPDFANPSIFETPTEVKARWYKFLAGYIASIVPEGKNRRATVLVAHYELLCNIVHDLFGIVSSEATALQHTEPVFIAIHRTKIKSTVLFEGRFRDLANFRVFDVANQRFV